MSSKEFMVKEVSSDGVIVVPFDKNGCAGCGGSCSGCKVTLSAQNPANLPLRVGCLVNLNYSTAFQKAMNLASVLLPVLCAVLAFIFAPQFSMLFGVRCTEGFKSAITLFGFVIPALALFLVTRFVKVELQVTKITHS